MEKQLTPCIRRDAPCGDRIRFSGELCNQHARGYTAASIATTHRSIQERIRLRHGWPSFWEAIAAKMCVRKKISARRAATEVKCTLCDAHLGHVFPDGPERRLALLMNSAALLFVPRKASFAQNAYRNGCRPLTDAGASEMRFLMCSNKPDLR